MARNKPGIPKTDESVAKSDSPPKRDYRFQMKGHLFGGQFVTIIGVVGDEAEARAELHRWVDASIVGIEAKPIRDSKSLKELADGKAIFDDGATLELPAGTTITQDGPAWLVSLADCTRVWRPGFSWHRIRQEIAQLRCAAEREARKEKPRLFPVGAA